MNHTSHVHLMMSTTSWQMPSTSQSLTLRSHFGNFFWMRKAVRLPFGTNVSGDCHQRGIDSIYGKLDKVIGIADDLLIWGNEEDGSDHDHAL